MMRSEITRFDLRLRRRLLVGYCLGMAFYGFVIVYLYPDFKNSTSLNQLVKNGSTAAALFGITGSITSPSGWLGANLYENFLPLIMLLVCIGYATGCLAGSDEDGTLSLIATLPISRRSLLFQKMATLAVQAVSLSLITMLTMLAGRYYELSVPFAHLAGASLGVTLLGVDFGLLAIAVGSWSQSRGTALAVSSSLAAASYLTSSLAPVISWMGPAKYASLFYWSVGNAQLARGLSLAALGVLVGVGATLAVLAAVSFSRQDLH
jgi:beta-exotoxin I transport system permease protein